jgi:hypothetical protein
MGKFIKVVAVDNRFATAGIKQKIQQALEKQLIL